MQIALKGETWMIVEARSWRVRLVPAGSSWLCQLGSVQYYKWVISALFTICLRNITSLQRSRGKIKDASVCIQWILSLSLCVLFHPVFFGREQRMKKWFGIFIAFSSISVTRRSLCGNFLVYIPQQSALTPDWGYVRNALLEKSSKLWRQQIWSEKLGWF